ncbi:hypothetical protein [Nostoc sp.]
MSKFSKDFNDLHKYGELIRPGSEAMINHLRWCAMEVLNEDYRRKSKLGITPYTEETIPRDYWIQKTKEIALERILKDFPGQGPPETLYASHPDIIKNAIEETIKIYGKLPYIDEPNFRKKSDKLFSIFIIFILFVFIGLGFIGYSIFQQNFNNQKIDKPIQK